MDKAFYFGKLYPLQDRVLQAVRSLDTGFYLSGGTAASRAYLHHRFSDDLDLFVNDDEHFALWANRIVDMLSSIPDYQLTVLTKEERFVRTVLSSSAVSLRIEMINDIPSRF